MRAAAVKGQHAARDEVRRVDGVVEEQRRPVAELVVDDAEGGEQPEVHRRRVKGHAAREPYAARGDAEHEQGHAAEVHGVVVAVPRRERVREEDGGDDDRVERRRGELHLQRQPVGPEVAEDPQRDDECRGRHAERHPRGQAPRLEVFPSEGRPDDEHQRREDDARPRHRSLTALGGVGEERVHDEEGAPGGVGGNQPTQRRDLALPGAPLLGDHGSPSGSARTSACPRPGPVPRMASFTPARAVTHST